MLGALVVVLAPVVQAQHGTAAAGYYPGGYAGDTWTGVITSVNERGRVITIAHVRDGEREIFKGILASSYTARKGSLEAPNLDLAKIVTGTRARAYYFRDRSSAEMERWRDPKAFPFQKPVASEKFNVVFLLELLDDKGESTTGTVSATDDQTREITLAVTKGGKTETFVGELIESLEMRRPDGRTYELKVSQIPVGTALTVVHMRDKKKVSGQKISYHLIYRLEPPRK